MMLHESKSETFYIDLFNNFIRRIDYKLFNG